MLSTVRSGTSVTPPSSSGLGHRILSPKTGVRLPVGVSSWQFHARYSEFVPGWELYVDSISRKHSSKAASEGSAYFTLKVVSIGTTRWCSFFHSFLSWSRTRTVIDESRNSTMLEPRSLADAPTVTCSTPSST